MRVRFSLCLLVAAACGPAPVSLAPAKSGDGKLTSVTGTQEQIQWDGFVYVAQGASDDVALAAVRLQVKSFLGVGRTLQIEPADRDALHSVSLTGRDTVFIANGGGSFDRVRYHLQDTALVTTGTAPGAATAATLLFGDYVSNAASLIPICSDDTTTDPGSLWYHYTPTLTACAQAIQTETTSLVSASSGLPAGQISQADASRRFIPVSIKLTPMTAAPVKYPEYDRLLGFGSSRDRVVVYSFFGVNQAETPDELGLVESLRFVRTLLARWPTLHVTYTNPQDMLLTYTINGQQIPNVSYQDVCNWIIDGTGYPAAVGSDPNLIAQLEQQVVSHWAERWIYWDVPITATLNGQTRSMTVEIRTYWGLEDDGGDTYQHAVWRYLEAFWYGDVFLYGGHSHFGNGPLDPQNFGTQNFPTDRWQTFLFDSCLSYNYYDQDFLGMHPAGSRNLDVVVNGLPAYWEYMGQANAWYVIDLVEGHRSWSQIVTDMQTPDPTGRAATYDPLRAVNGELDNAYDPSTTGAIQVSVDGVPVPQQ